MNSDSKRAQWAVIVLAVVVASMAYRIVQWGNREHTALLFVGIPAILAVVVVLMPPAKTAKGAIMKAMTIALLVSAPLLGEGFICILMASPLFYAVGLVIGATVDSNRKSRPTVVGCLMLAFLPMTFEGASPNLSFNRHETVQATRVVEASAAEVEQALSASPRIDQPLPAYLRIGFPRPTAAHGEGLEVGATRTIRFTGGMGSHTGDLHLEVSDSKPGHVVFQVVADHSHIIHWLFWESAEVTWTPIDARHTSVTWTLHFQRRLDPAWYFRPWERYATRLAAEYLIEANATPAPQVQG